MLNFFCSGVPHLGRSKLKDMGMHSWAWNPAKSDLTKKRIFVFLLLLSQKYTFSLSRLLSHDVKVNNVANKTKPVTADASMVIRLKTQSLSTQITLRIVTQRSLVDASHHEWQNQASKVATIAETVVFRLTLSCCLLLLLLTSLSPSLAGGLDYTE